MVFTNYALTRRGVGAMISERSRDARVVELADSLDSGSSAHSGRAGSSPASRTTSSRTSYRSRRRFLFQSKRHLSFTSSLLLSAKGHARLACSVASALATARCRYQPFAGYRVCRYHYSYQKQNGHPTGRPFCFCICKLLIQLSSCASCCTCQARSVLRR